ncbi:hypothetical protein MRX96_043512 [Rhipicephalus microplus]
MGGEFVNDSAPLDLWIGSPGRLDSFFCCRPNERRGEHRSGAQALAKERWPQLSLQESPRERKREGVPSLKKTASGGGGLKLRMLIGQSPAPRGVSSSVGWVVIPRRSRQRTGRKEEDRERGGGFG